MIPVDVVAPLGTKVFIRQRIVTTAGFESETDPGFWHQFDASDAGFLKMIRSGTVEAAAGEASSLRVVIVPNPARSTAEIRVTAAETGTIELGVYDVTGNLVEAIPATPVSRPGEYVVTVDVSGLASGFYSVRARLGSHRITAPLTVAR